MSKLGRKIIAALKEGLRKLKSGEIEIPIVRGSKNVYADMGLENADELMAKSELTARIVMVIRKNRMKHARAIDRMGATPSEFDAIRAGRLDGFSAERLRGMLETLLKAEGEDQDER